MTRIAYISDFSQDWYTPVHIARDAEKIGCEVDRWDEQEIAANGFPFFQREYDLVLYTKHHGLPAWATDLWRELEEHGIQTASQHLDLYRPLTRGTEILDDPFWRVGTCFTADGDPDTQTELELLGVNHHWLPAACVSDECVTSDTLGGDFVAGEIVFVGSWRGYHGVWPWRMQMLDALRARYGHRFTALPRTPDRPIRGLALNALYQTPGRIVVGDSLALPGHRNYWSDRYYETIGRGGFLIAPRVPGLETHFQDGGHFVGYDVGDLSGLFGLIDGYLDAPEVARQIADAGQAHVAANHTYQHRVRAMLAALGLREMSL